MPCNEINTFRFERRITTKEPLNVSVSREHFSFLSEKVGEFFPGFETLNASEKADFLFYLAYKKPEKLMAIKDMK